VGERRGLPDGRGILGGFSERADRLFLGGGTDKKPIGGVIAHLNLLS